LQHQGLVAQAIDANGNRGTQGLPRLVLEERSFPLRGKWPKMYSATGKRLIEDGALIENDGAYVFVTDGGVFQV